MSDDGTNDEEENETETASRRCSPKSKTKTEHVLAYHKTLSKYESSAPRLGNITGHLIVHHDDRDSEEGCKSGQDDQEGGQAEKSSSAPDRDEAPTEDKEAGKESPQSEHREEAEIANHKAPIAKIEEQLEWNSAKH